MENHGGRIVIDANGKRTEHRIHIGGQLDGLNKEDRAAAVAAAHGYDAKAGLRFNLLNGANGVTPAQRAQLMTLPAADRNQILDLGDVAAIGARLKELATPAPVKPADPKGTKS